MATFLEIIATWVVLSPIGIWIYRLAFKNGYAAAIAFHGKMLACPFKLAPGARETCTQCGRGWGPEHECQHGTICVSSYPPPRVRDDSVCITKEGKVCTLGRGHYGDHSLA